MLHPALPLAVSWLRPSLEPPSLVAGVLSGTSADGIDVVLAVPEFGPESGPQGHGTPELRSVRAVAFATEPFAPELRERLRAILDGAAPSLAELARLDRDLGLAFGHAARSVAERHGVGELVVVASHGQTVFHHDGDPAVGRVTLQLGDGDFVAEAAGTAVVSDFRTRDCAAGGEGAPLVALVDDLLFASAPRPLAILNLGGMANWTVLESLGGAPVGFDTGPAGALLDGLARLRLRASHDEGGRAALAGRVHDDRICAALEHPFFDKSGPRSTGRDTFGEPWVAGFARRCEDLSTEDLLATACAFVASTCARALAGELAQAESRPWTLAAAGGGVHNERLMNELRRSIAAVSALRTPVFESTEAFGVPPDAREALAFAALGVRHLLGLPSTSPGVTGARGGRVLGKFSPKSGEPQESLPPSVARP